MPLDLCYHACEWHGSCGAIETLDYMQIVQDMFTNAHHILRAAMDWRLSFIHNADAVPLLNLLILGPKWHRTYLCRYAVRTEVALVNLQQSQPRLRCSGHG